MIDFVLKQFGKASTRLQRPFCSELIQEGHLDCHVPLKEHKDVGEGETIVPQPELCAAAFRDPGIDQRSGVFEIDIDDLLRYADLGGRNATSETAPCPEVGERFAQIGDGCLDIICADIAHRLAAPAQDRVPQKKDFFDGHSGFWFLSEENIEISDGGCNEVLVHEAPFPKGGLR